ncbi:unnamed protein product [Sympodiomycopsis kandeliae]
MAAPSRQRLPYSVGRVYSSTPAFIRAQQTCLPPRQLRSFKRKGTASRKWSESKKRASQVTGPIPSNGSGNMQGAHILPDRYAGSAFGNILDAVR